MLFDVDERFAHDGEQRFGRLGRQQPLAADQHQVSLQTGPLAEVAHHGP